MERDRAFNFKLMVPPRVNPGQISAVKPQEISEDFGGFMNTLKQGYSKHFDKESNFPIPSANMGSTKPKADFCKTIFVPPTEKEESDGKPGQIYSKLFDEVEKVKCWKVKVDSEIEQKERKLLENKRTIETQRKAIQDLQFGNESLSIKLDEQISENSDLRNKNNATRDLCNILKDTFQRTADKMHLFESEREETHHLYMENSENIQRMIAAFESLRIQAESDCREMEKVKEELLQYNNLKEKFGEEINMKQLEVEQLQMAMKQKETELLEIVLHLNETQECCQRLQEAAKQQHEVLQSSHQERESLLEKLQRAEELNTKIQENMKAFETALELNKEESAQIMLQKDTSIGELNKVKDAQAGQLAEIQATVQELQTSLTLEIERAQELELKLTSITEELQQKTILIGAMNEQNEKKEEQIHVLEEELDVKSKSVESLKERTEAAESRALVLASELAGKTEQVQQCMTKVEIMKTENNLLKTSCGNAELAHNDLRSKTHTTEARVQEMEELLFVATARNETSTKEMEQLKRDLVQQEGKYDELWVSFHELQREKRTIEEQAERDSSQAQSLEARLEESEARGTKISKEIKALGNENLQLREEVNSLTANLAEHGRGAENLQKKFDQSCGDLQVEITKKEKHIKAMETKLSNLKAKLEANTKSRDECQKEAKLLKKQIAKEAEKSCLLENEINQLKEAAENLQRSSEEKCQELLNDVTTRSASEAELHKEVQKLKLTAADATKSKEEAEVKCQHKIADMVALMEKHKNQYDKLVVEKDAELDERRRSEAEAGSSRAALELELSQSKIDNEQLKKRLDKEVKERETLVQKISELEDEVTSVKSSQQLNTRRRQSGPRPATGERGSETPETSGIRRHTFDLTETKQKTPTQSRSKTMTSTPGVTETTTDVLKTSWSSGNKVGATPRIKSYRIRTPPSTQKSVPWRMTPLELDPKSDSSEPTDLLSFAVTAEPLHDSQQGASCSSVFRTAVSVFKKNASPAIHKSPGNALKLAAMKRMRDAGWTAVMGSGKKKKNASEKIFA